MALTGVGGVGRVGVGLEVAAVLRRALVRRSRRRSAFAADLRPKITALMETLSVPGAIVYVDVPGKGTWLTAFGSATTEGAPPMNTDDHMRIGSVTKSLTAEVVLQLVDQGTIGLDDPVTKYLPGVPNGDHITIRELLGMTAGIFNYTEDDYFNLTLDKDPLKPWTPSSASESGSPMPYFPPGQGFHYSNTNTNLLLAPNTYFGEALPAAGIAQLVQLVQQTIFPGQIPGLSSAARSDGSSTVSTSSAACGRSPTPTRVDRPDRIGAGPGPIAPGRSARPPSH